jgi:predicted nucleotidyltransferase
MRRDDVIAKLRRHEAELQQLGVLHLYLFGSTVRGTARQDSDVDLFFGYERGKLGLFELMDIKEQASRILGRLAEALVLSLIVLRQLQNDSIRGGQAHGRPPGFT